MWRNYMRARFDPDARLGLRLTLLVAALLVVAVPFGILLREVTVSGPLTRVDTAAAGELHDYVRDSPLVVNVLKVITFFGSSLWFYCLIVPLVVLLLRRGETKAALFLGGTTWLGAAINSVVKVLVDRPRPSLVDPVATAHGQSFPSGHSMAAVVGYGALLIVFLPSVRKRLRWAVIAAAGSLALLIGFTRLALGVHYITDVLGGYALGGAWLLASASAFRIWRRPTQKKEIGLVHGGPT
ncbi:MAG: hypothetical protein QOH26_577 [Actinomycetota bacterium]|nr:hypothetical protein [Actinomycetota bacterium]